jgi:hypothetical protein
MPLAVSAFAASLLFLFSPVTRPDEAPAVTVRLYQPFGGARETAAVEKAAAHIFERSGIELRWVDCSAPGSEWAADSPCNRTPRPGDIILRVLETSAAGRGACSHGFALLPPGGRVGGLATVFVDGIRRLERNTEASKVQILGHFTAHEIGHLLLGEGHSSAGLMRAEWSVRDLDRAARGRLSFTPDQSERMRQRLAAAGAGSTGS